MNKTGIIIKICILCQPSDLISYFIPELLDNFEGKTVQFDYSFLGVKPATFKHKINTQPIKFLLIHTVNQDLSNKLRPYYLGASGAFIIFSRSNPDSYEAAKCFYQYFRKITTDPRIPVAFIDIREESATILIENGIKLDNESSEAYYEMKAGDFQGFRRVFETLITTIVSFAHQQSTEYHRGLIQW
ncbi:MAG: hypothetical protein ACFE95_00150 [Candidatus Hodarchaeota archaeon]